MPACPALSRTGMCYFILLPLDCSSSLFLRSQDPLPLQNHYQEPPCLPHAGGFVSLPWVFPAVVCVVSTPLVHFQPPLCPGRGFTVAGLQRAMLQPGGRGPLRPCVPQLLSGTDARRMHFDEAENTWVPQSRSNARSGANCWHFSATLEARSSADSHIHFEFLNTLKATCLQARFPSVCHPAQFSRVKTPPFKSGSLLDFKVLLKVRQAGAWDPWLQGLHLDKNTEKL